RFARLVVFVGLEMTRDLTGQARRRHDDAFVVLGQQLAIDAWLGVKALRERQRGELHEIAIANLVTRQKDEVIIGLRSTRGPAPLASIAWRDIGFHADDRLDSSF